VNIGNIPPAILRSLHNRPMKWATALAELIDNSLDARSKKVVVTFSAGKSLEVSDEGIGCDDIERMLTLGIHMAVSPGGLGIYGVGLKDTACWLWGHLIIKTRRDQTIRHARIDWEKLANGKIWDVPDPHVTTVNTEDIFKGTSLKFTKIQRTPPDYAKLVEELGWIFAPALGTGAEITVVTMRGSELACLAWTPPPRDQIVQDTFEINGKQVDLDAGIVPPGIPNPRPGFSFSYRHRNICNTALGSNGYSVARICGTVKLGSGWTLSTNKTEIANDQEELADAIWDRCQHIILSAAEQAILIDNAALEVAINERLEEFLDTKTQKAKRDKGDKQGTKYPTGNGSQHTNARNRQPGAGNIRGRRGGFTIEWRDFSDETIGQTDFPGKKINLNASHPFLSSLRAQGNVDGIVGLALSLFCQNDMCRSEPLFAKHSAMYSDELGRLLAKQPTSANVLLEAAT